MTIALAPTDAGTHHHRTAEFSSVGSFHLGPQAALSRAPGASFL
jgi:hypothetical protein